MGKLVIGAVVAIIVIVLIMNFLPQILMVLGFLVVAGFLAIVVVIALLRAIFK